VNAQNPVAFGVFLKAYRIIKIFCSQRVNCNNHLFCYIVSGSNVIGIKISSGSAGLLCAIDIKFIRQVVLTNY